MPRPLYPVRTVFVPRSVGWCETLPSIICTVVPASCGVLFGHCWMWCVISAALVMFALFRLFCFCRRNYGFPPTANDPVPILFGPGLESQQTVSEVPSVYTQHIHSAYATRERAQLATA